MSPRVGVCGEDNSLKGRIRRETECETHANESYMPYPKPRRSNHGQDEVGVKPHGGPNVSVLKNGAMTCG